MPDAGKLTLYADCMLHSALCPAAEQAVAYLCVTAAMHSSAQGAQTPYTLLLSLELYIKCASANQST